MFPYVSVNAEHNWVCLGMETFFLLGLSINQVWGKAHLTRNNFLSILHKNTPFKIFPLVPPPLPPKKSFFLTAVK